MEVPRAEVAEDVLREELELVVDAPRLLPDEPRLLPDEPRLLLVVVDCVEVLREVVLVVAPRLLPLDVERLLMSGAFWLPLLSR